MNNEIIELIEDGDFHFKEAKSLFLNNQDDHCNATCHGCKALKSYLDAYMLFLNDHYKPTDNFHLLIRTILRLDSEFEQFYPFIFDVKCFAEEAKSQGDSFFLFDIEVNKAIHALEDIRNYITEKIHFEKHFLSEYERSSLMGT
jgi:hypothetical protein